VVDESINQRGRRDLVAQNLAPLLETFVGQQAWTKAVLLEIALWSRPYTRDGLW
jgi:hypothetical protein